MHGIFHQPDAIYQVAIDRLKQGRQVIRTQLNATCIQEVTTHTNTHTHTHTPIQPYATVIERNKHTRDQ